MAILYTDVLGGLLISILLSVQFSHNILISSEPIIWRNQLIFVYSSTCFRLILNNAADAFIGKIKKFFIKMNPQRRHATNERLLSPSFTPMGASENSNRFFPTTFEKVLVLRMWYTHAFFCSKPCYHYSSF